MCIMSSTADSYKHSLWLNQLTKADPQKWKLEMWYIRFLP